MHSYFYILYKCLHWIYRGRILLPKKRGSTLQLCGVVFACYISSSVIIFADLFLSVFEGCGGVYNREENRAGIYAWLLISAQLRLRRLTQSMLLWRCEACSLVLYSVSILFVSLCCETVYVNLYRKLILRIIMFNDTFKFSSIFLKLSLIPAFLGFVNHLVSFASSNWRVIDTPVPLLKIYPHVDHTYCGLWNCYSCLSNNADCESALFPLEGKLSVLVESKMFAFDYYISKSKSSSSYITRQNKFMCNVELSMIMINICRYFSIVKIKQDK